MAKKKRKSSPSGKRVKSHPKAAMITWIILGALIVGLVAGYMVAKAKYMYYIGQISIMFSQKDSQLNELKTKMNQAKTDSNKVEF